MSSALSLPAIRNFACCHTNSARSRVVKYLRAASPRANQNSDAPIIIVLSTSKNAAAVGPGGTASGAATSAAAAEASPARCARVSWSGTERGICADRPRNGRRGTETSPTLRLSLGSAATGPTLTGDPGGCAGGQQMIGGRHTRSGVSMIAEGLLGLELGLVLGAPGSGVGGGARGHGPAGPGAAAGGTAAQGGVGDRVLPPEPRELEPPPDPPLESGEP